MLPYEPYGGPSGREYVAQSFVATAPRLHRAGILVYGHTTPYPDIQLLLVADNDGTPDLAQVLAASQSFALTAQDARYFIASASSLRLQLGTRYWIVARFTMGSSGTAGVRYASATYPGGRWVFSDDAGVTWKTHPGLAEADLNIRVEYATPPSSNMVEHMVMDPPRCLDVAPQSLRFYAVQDAAAPAGKTVQIENCDLGHVNWTAFGNAAWLNLLPTTGQAPSLITVTVNHTGLLIGRYYANVTVDGGDARNSPQTIDVTLDVGSGKVYLPLTMRNWPPRPPALTFSVPNQSGDYTISWNDTGADFYILHEADNTNFIGAKEIYSGTATFVDILDYGPTRYYYRIRGSHNAYITSWSSPQFVDVVWEKEPNDSRVEANGPLISGVTYYGHFNDAKDYFAINVAQAGRVTMTLWGGSATDSIALRDVDDKIINDTCFKWLRDSNPLECTLTQPGQYYFQVYSSTPRQVEYRFTIVHP